jgi:hypothetical protein
MVVLGLGSKRCHYVPWGISCWDAMILCNPFSFSYIRVFLVFQEVWGPR